MSSRLAVRQTLSCDGALIITKELIAGFAITSGDASIVHLDDAAAQSFGFPRALAHGLLGMTFAGRLLTRHFDQREIKRLRCRFVAMTFVGDELSCQATVTKVSDSAGETEICLTLRACDRGGREVMTGQAVIRTASR